MPRAVKGPIIVHFSDICSREHLRQRERGMCICFLFAKGSYVPSTYRYSGNVVRLMEMPKQIGSAFMRSTLTH